MRRFVWRLQRVLDIRTKQEQVKTQELFALTEKLAQARGELLTQRRILQGIIESITRERTGERIGKQEFFLRNSSATDEQIKRLEVAVKELENRQKDMIAEVLKIRRSKEGLERLREQAKKRYIEEQDKLEQSQMDEMAVMSFVRGEQDSRMTENQEIRKPGYQEK
jgi:flagellar export protein FliJ